MKQKKFIHGPLQDYIYALSQGNAAPGGGSAVALAGACACACALMAVQFALQSKKTAAKRRHLERTKKFFLLKRTFFLAAVDRDIALYNTYDALRKRVKREPRLAKRYQRAVNNIIDIQYELVLAALESQKHLMGLYDTISKQLMADLEVAFFLFIASTEGGIKNCILNLTFLNDAQSVHAVKQRLIKLFLRKNALYKMMRRF